jgi:hypothetical protein
MAQDGPTNAPTSGSSNALRGRWKNTFESDLERIGLVASQGAQFIDIDLFYDSTPIEGRAPDTLTGTEKNAYTAGTMLAWSGVSKEQTRDEMLADLQEDFRGWSAEHFRELKTPLRRALCNWLRKHGVAIPSAHNSPNNTILAQLVREGALALTQTQAARESWGPPILRPELTLRGKTNAPEAGYTGFNAPQNRPAIRLGPQELPGFSPPGNEHPNEEWVFPPPVVPNQEIEASTVVAFAQVWHKESSYSGEKYDILDDKVRMLYHTCQTLQIKYPQLHAIFLHALTGRAKDWLVQNVRPAASFAHMYQALKEHFDTESNQAQYYSEWTTLSFHSMRSEHLGKSNPELLQLLLDKLQFCQRALGNAYHGDQQLVRATLRACNGVPELRMALANPCKSFEALASQLRSTLAVEEGIKAQYLTEHYLVDRHYGRRDRGDRYGEQRNHSPSDRNSSKSRGSSTSRRKWHNKCWICGKEGCRSTKHPERERQHAKDRWKGLRKFNDFDKKRSYNAFLIEYEGPDGPEDETGSADDLEEADTESAESVAEQYLTASYLANRSWLHRQGLIEQDIPDPECQAQVTTVCLLDQYSKTVFQGIIPHTGAAKHSTGGYSQYLALKKQLPGIEIDRARAGEVTIRFGDGAPRSSVGAIQIELPIGTTLFHIMDTATPFLLCLRDMDKLGVWFNNTNNELQNRNGARTPVIRKWGHPWFFTNPRHDIAPVISLLTEPASFEADFLTVGELTALD